MRNLDHHSLPAFKVSLLLCAGILAGRRLPGTGSTFVLLVALFAFTSLLLLLLLTRRPCYPERVISIIAAFLCFLGGVTKIASDRARSVVLPDSLFRKAAIVGCIQEAATVIAGRTRLAVRSRAVLCDGVSHAFPTNLLVTFIPSARDSCSPRLDYGMSVILYGNVEPPSAERNPGEFSPREYYEANGVTHLMTVRGADKICLVDSAGGSWFMRELVLPVRRGVFAFIDSTISGEEGELLKGLMIGDRSGISQETREAFVNSGVAHVLAVSGSNVAVVAGIFIFIFGMIRLPGRIRTIAVLAGLVFYMVLTGNQPPVVRATIMAFVFFLARLFQQKSNAYNAMGVAAMVILGLDARQLFDVGFQLSFVAVLSIIYLYPKANAWISLLPDAAWWQRGLLWLLRICAVSLVATLGTLPLAAVSFGKVSVIGIAANLFVIPAVELSVVLGFASVCTSVVSHWFAEGYAAANGVLLTLTLRLIRAAGNVSCAYIDTTTFAPIDSLPFYAGLFLLFNHEGRKFVFGLMALLLSLNIAVFGPRGEASAMARGVMRVSFIDVGQGDAILIELPGGRCVLTDAGMRSANFDAGERIVTPFLKRRGISTIDLFVISHGHNDHAGGAVSVVRNFDVKRVACIGGLPSALRDLMNVPAGSVLWCDSVRAGMSLLDSANARLYVVYPLDVRTGTDAYTATDNRCIVFKLQYGTVSFLFTGDAGGAAEAEMVGVYGPFLRSSLLKAGHHGSSTSSTPLFLDAVRPATAVISVGRNNKFRHPSPPVVDRLQALCGTLARTDEDGAVIFETDGIGLWRWDWR